GAAGLVGHAAAGHDGAGHGLLHRHALVGADLLDPLLRHHAADPHVDRGRAALRAAPHPGAGRLDPPLVRAPDLDGLGRRRTGRARLAAVALVVVLAHAGHEALAARDFTALVVPHVHALAGDGGHRLADGDGLHDRALLAGGDGDADRPAHLADLGNHLV